MKLVVLGANGRTGQLVVHEALERGDDVTAVVRSETKRLSFEHPRLNVVAGDPCNSSFLASVFQGHDAVVSTLGGRSPSKKATSIYWMSAEAIGEAASRVGLKKAVVTSSALLFRRRSLLDMLLSNLVRNVVQSAERMEETLSSSGLNVTVARCGFLTDVDERRYRAALDELPANGSSVSRRSLAAFLVDRTRDVSSGTAVFGVSRPARA